jgi:hypothetical protein
MQFGQKENPGDVRFIRGFHPKGREARMALANFLHPSTTDTPSLWIFKLYHSFAEPTISQPVSETQANV